VREDGLDNLPLLVSQEMHRSCEDSGFQPGVGAHLYHPHLVLGEQECSLNVALVKRPKLLKLSFWEMSA